MVGNVSILEHSSSSYAPRTYANAAKADVTIALAVDYSTAGEKLTHKAAGDKYLKLDPNKEKLDNARSLWRRLHYFCGSRIINVAGNGIYTLQTQGITQEHINWYVYDILSIVHKHCTIDRIVSGGQTGVDIAGGWAGVKLGIDVELLLPKGFKQRHEDGIDVNHTKEEILSQITSGTVMEQLYG